MSEPIYTTSGFVPFNAAIRTWNDWRKADHGQAVTWGQPWLDEALGKLMPGAVAVIGAATNMGKTFFMLGMAHGAADAGVNAGLVSCEDPLPEMGRRLSLFGDTGHGFVSVPAHPKLSTIRAVLSEGTRIYGLKAWYVDYLQAIRYDESAPVFSPKDTATTIVQYLKGDAREHGVPLVLGSQLRRPPADAVGPTRPTMHWLKESGDIENMAEYVLLLSAQDRKTIRCEVAKAKNAETGQEVLYRRGAGGRLELVDDVDFGETK